MDEVHVVGAGGIGCAVGYALAEAGLDVTFVDTDHAKIAWGQSNGVRVDDKPRRPARFVSFEHWEPPKYRIILLCTKCYDNPAVLARLPSDSSFVPIQNGFDSTLEARQHHLEGIASFVSECTPGQTHTRITRPGRLHVGIRHANGQSTQPWIVAPFYSSKLFRATWVPDILPYKYTKLMYNAAISPVASIAGIDNGQLLSIKPARQLFFALLQENHRILREARIPLEKIGPFHPNKVAQILRRRWLARALSWAFYPSLRGTYCSMSGDLPKGRTEIDYYNGRLIELAGENHCPLNQRVYETVKKMEMERTTPALRILDELL